MYVFKLFQTLRRTILTGSKDMQRVWHQCVQWDRSRGLLFHGSSDKGVPEQREDRHAQPRRRDRGARFLLELAGEGVRGSNMGHILGRLESHTAIWFCRTGRVRAVRLFLSPISGHYYA